MRLTASPIKMQINDIMSWNEICEMTFEHVVMQKSRTKNKIDLGDSRASVIDHGI